MDPIVATWSIKLTVRAPGGSDVEEPPTNGELEKIIETAVVEQLSGNGTLVSANAIAERTDN
jgi:hypothetical protein